MKKILMRFTALMAQGFAIAFSAIVALPMTGSLAYAVDQYDGKWVGTAPDKGDCGPLTVTMVIGSSVITGYVNGKHGSPTITSGKVEADGTVQVKYAGNQGFQGKLKFSGDKFEGQFMTFCGLRDVVGGRQ